MMLSIAPLHSFPLDVNVKPKPKPLVKQTTLLESVSVVTKTAVSSEYASLRHLGHCPLGMYVIPTVDNILEWDCVLFIHQGYYTDAILKFKLIFHSNYPDRPPIVQFLTDVFHPLISQDGIFHFGPRFHPWRPKEHHVFDILHWVKASFKKDALDAIPEFDAVNKEAYRYHESTSSFSALAVQTSSLSQSDSALYDNDYPAMGGKSNDAFLFKRLPVGQLATARTELGLQEWSNKTE